MVRSKVKVVESGAIMHFAIWIGVFVILLAVAVNYFSTIFDVAEEAEAEAAIQSFAQSVVTLHKEWILQGKPRRIRATALDSQGNEGKDWIILMNRAGWPINVLDGNDVPDCTALWFALQKANRLPFATTLVKMDRNSDGSLKPMAFNPDLEEARKRGVWVCQNKVANKLQFRYRLDTGKVEMISQSATLN